MLGDFGSKIDIFGIKISKVKKFIRKYDHSKGNFLLFKVGPTCIFRLYKGAVFLFLIRRPLVFGPKKKRTFFLLRERPENTSRKIAICVPPPPPIPSR